MLSTCSRKPGCKAAIGAAPASSAGLSSRRLRSPQTSHCSICQADPLAHQHGHLAVPAGQHGVEIRAGLLPGAGHHQRAQRAFQLAAGAGQQGVGVVARHAEGGGEILARQLMPQAQLDDIPLGGIQPAERLPDQLPQFGLFGGAADVRRFGWHLHRLVECGCGLAGTQQAEALVPGHRIQPGAELAGILEPAELGRGDEERVLHGIGGVRGLGQHGPAVGVQRHGIPVVGHGDPAGVARHDGGYDVPVFHAPYRSSVSADRSGRTANVRIAPCGHPGSAVVAQPAGATMRHAGPTAGAAGRRRNQPAGRRRTARPAAISGISATAPCSGRARPRCPQSGRAASCGLPGPASR